MLERLLVHRATFFPLTICYLQSYSDIKEAKEQIIKESKKDTLQNSTSFEILDLTEDKKVKSESINGLIKTTSLSLRKDQLRLILIPWSQALLKTGNYNKLLKLFEEPPKNNIIVLFSDDRTRIPKTIKSRGIQIWSNLETKNKTDATSLETFLTTFKDDTNKQYEELVNYFCRYCKGELDILEMSQKLKSNPEDAETVLRGALQYIQLKSNGHTQFAMLGKIINKYSKAKELNLNKFDNILIPLKFLLSSGKI